MTAFERLKKALSATPVLQLPNFKEFVVECDASEGGIRAVQRQQGNPIASSVVKMQSDMPNFLHMNES